MRYRRRLSGNYIDVGPGVAVVPSSSPPPLIVHGGARGAGLSFAQAMDLTVQWERRVVEGGDPVPRNPRPKGQIPGSIPFRFLSPAGTFLPAVAAEVTVLSFIVPAGRSADITRLANQLVTGGWNQGTSQLSWRIEVDGVAYQGYNNLNASIGTQALPADLTEAPIRAKENQLVAWILRNNSLVVGGNNPALALFAGYFYPQGEEEGGAWY